MLASPRASLWTLAAMAATAAAGGCVEREMTIRSDPPGALVYVDDYDIGITPVTTPFTYYGQRQVRLVKDGYETLTLLQPVTPPWYEFYGLDFISENIVPGKIRDQRVFEYRLAAAGALSAGPVARACRDPAPRGAGDGAAALLAKCSGHEDQSAPRRRAAGDGAGPHASSYRPGDRRPDGLSVATGRTVRSEGKASRRVYPGGLAAPLPARSCRYDATRAGRPVCQRRATAGINPAARFRPPPSI